MYNDDNNEMQCILTNLAFESTLLEANGKLLYDKGLSQKKFAQSLL